MRKAILSTVLIILFLLPSILANSQKTPMPKAALNHIALYVMDLGKSSSFYHDIVGLDTIPEPFHDGKHVWFSVGPKSHLHLIEGAKSKADPNKHNHLCFSVASVEDFADLLKKNNISFENWAGDKNTITKRVDGVKQVYLRDPDGYWIEINDAKE